MMLARMAAMGGGKSYALWNTNDKAGNITLSNGFLTYSMSSGSGKARATIPLSTGKWYWEVTVVSTTGYTMVGITRGSTSVAQSVGYHIDDRAYTSTTGGIWSNSSGGAYGASYTAGDNIGVALDMSAGTLTFYKNGVSQGVAATGLSGTYYPAVGNNPEVLTANFGATAFAYPVPSGYNPGVYT